MNRNIISMIMTGIISLISVSAALGQDAAKTAIDKPTVPEILYNPSFYLIAFVFLIMFVAIISLTRTIRILAYGLLPEEKKKAIAIEKEKSTYEELKAPSFWTRFDRDILTRAVPVEKEADIMLDHNYDGIKELDNSLPPWWIWGFYITIIWSVVYLVHYHVFDTGALSAEEYKNEIAMADQALKERQAKMANFISSENVTMVNTPEGLGSGKDIFTKNCVACHGQGGEGTVGPNLTDEFWIHGGGIKNVFNTVTNGVPAKGMIAWKSQLSPKQIQEVSSYILTLQGTKPANGKAPEGEKWVEQGATPSPNDSSTVKKDSLAVVTADLSVSMNK